MCISIIISIVIIILNYLKSCMLEVKKICMKYNSKKVLNNISLYIDEGEIRYNLNSIS